MIDGRDIIRSERHAQHFLDAGFLEALSDGLEIRMDETDLVPIQEHSLPAVRLTGEIDPDGSRHIDLPDGPWTTRLHVLKHHNGEGDDDGGEPEQDNVGQYASFGVPGTTVAGWVLAPITLDLEESEHLYAHTKTGGQRRLVLKYQLIGFNLGTVYLGLNAEGHTVRAVIACCDPHYFARPIVIDRAPRWGQTVSQAADSLEEAEALAEFLELLAHRQHSDVAHLEHGPALQALGYPLEQIGTQTYRLT